MSLTDAERAILNFERAWWQSDESKQSGIRDVLSMSPSAYYRRLHDLIDRPDAAAADPLLVKRLRRARSDRRRTRFVGPQRKRSQP